MRQQSVHDGERRPEQIEAEISRTRAELDSTLNAIEHRLTVGQLVDQGMDYLRHSGANEFMANLGVSVKQNPLPVTLVGLGVAWLMMSGRQQDAPAEGAHAGGTLREMRGRAGESMQRVSGAASSAATRISETTQAARETFSSAAAGARERTARMGETTQRQFYRAREGYQHMLQEQPLALGAIGLAMGAIIAAALPRSRREDELMGEARDELADQAREAGREHIEKARHVAAAAREAAAEARGQSAAEPPRDQMQPPAEPREEVGPPAMEIDTDVPSGGTERPQPTGPRPLR